MKKEAIAIGNDDFKEIIEKKSFYVDKTKFIEEILENHSDVKLFTRPRRFGKSLNISMLKYFFDIEKREENRKLFKDLYIERTDYMKEFGNYPVISISFKDIKDMTWKDTYKKIREEISDLYNEFKFIIEKLNPRDLEIFNNIWFNKEEGRFQDSLKLLSNFLYEYYNKKVVILIDEYDTPLILSYQNAYYEEAINFFKNMYGSVLKGNKNVAFGVITGIVRVAQARIFSDLNNIDVYTIMKKDYEEYFGFTEEEVKESLKKFGRLDKFEEVKYWYDGYKFGKVEIYNPWSIINYLKNDEFKDYWVNSSSNEVVIEILKQSKSDIIRTLEELIDGKEAMGKITEQVRLTGKLNENEIWEFLLFAGYIKVVEQFSNDLYTFKIPNNEVKSMFKTIFLDIVFDNQTSINELTLGLKTKNICRIKKAIENLLLYATSYWDLLNTIENKYELLLSGFLYGLEGMFRIYVNREVGYGRADIVLEPIDINIGYIFELKIKGNPENPRVQIDEKRYDAELKRKGVKDIVKLGMIFDGKRVEFVE